MEPVVGPEGSTSPGARWSPWWALALTAVSLLLPGAVLLLGLREISYGMTGAYMSEISEFIGPIITAVGAFLLVPGVFYLALRQRLLFITAMAISLAILVFITFTWFG